MLWSEGEGKFGEGGGESMPWADIQTEFVVAAPRRATVVGTASDRGGLHLLR